MPLQKRACFTAPTSMYEVGEGSSAVAAWQAGYSLAYRVDYGFVDTSIRASESRAMTFIGEVNDRVTDLATTQRQDAQELYVRCEDAQDDRALLELKFLYGGGRGDTFSRWILLTSVRLLLPDRHGLTLRRLRIMDEDRVTTHIQHDHNRFRDLVRAAEVGPQDGPADAGSSC
ncbi:hypothetical protein Tco_1468972 [Tanacetum coccineum]